jgi:hypothetical protein
MHVDKVHGARGCTPGIYYNTNSRRDWDSQRNDYLLINRDTDALY